MQHADELPPDDEPCIDVGGQIVLDAESQALAARLAHEAIQLSDQALAEPARSRLLHRLAMEQRRRKRSRRLATVGLGAIAVALGIWSWSSGWYNKRPQAGTQRARDNDTAETANVTPQSSHGGLAAGSSTTTEEPWPFLAAQEEASPGTGGQSDAERIRLLEMAVERYRAAVEAQQQRIRELEAELEVLRARLAVERARPDALPQPLP
jgi:multidrug resistance efflux pump